MAYTKTNWVNDSLPAINASNLNKIEQGIEDAHTLFPLWSASGDKSGCVEIGDLLIQWGNDTGAPSGSDTVKSWAHTVTFEKAYKYPPIVIPAISNSAVGTTMRATATSVAVGSFVLNVHRNSTSNTTAFWLAVGQKGE